MDWIVIKGAKPYDGRYEMDGDFTARELGWIRRLTGYLPAELPDAYRGSDAEVVTAVAVIALCRAGKIPREEVTATFDKLSDVKFGDAFETETDDDEAEADAGPPAQRSSSRPPTSGGGSPTSSESPDGTPPNTGTPGSVTSASGSMTLVT